jgi:hypothetical protein
MTPLFLQGCAMVSESWESIIQKSYILHIHIATQAYIKYTRYKYDCILFPMNLFNARSALKQTVLTVSMLLL